MSAPDGALQRERTRLAWQRTALTALAALLVVERLLFAVSVPVAITIAALTIGTGLVLGVALGRGGRGSRDGRILLLPTALAVLAGSAALAYAVVA